jgi:hypothetical protein
MNAQNKENAMNHKTVYNLASLIFALLLPISALAVCPDPETVTTVPKLVNVAVKATATYDSTTKIYSYFYSINNKSENIGCIWHYEIDINKPASGLSLPKDGLVNAPKFASLIVPGQDKPTMVPVTFPSVPQINNIITWAAGLTVEGHASWGSRRYEYELEPGNTISGIVMTSYGLPTIRDIKVQPKFIADEEDILKTGVSEEDFIPNAWKYINDFYDSLSWKGKSIGPTAPPANFQAITFIDYIIDLKHQAASLGWIVQEGILDSLDAKLDNAKLKLSQGNNLAAKNILIAFINESEAQACATYENCPPGKNLMPEAYVLLKYNVAYLINKL